MLFDLKYYKRSRNETYCIIPFSKTAIQKDEGASSEGSKRCS